MTPTRRHSYPANRKPRGRLPREFLNDARLVDAGIEVLAANGWSHLSPVAVSKAAGLSNATAYQRFPDRAATGLTLWNQRGAGIFTDRLLPSARALLQRQFRGGLAGRVEAFAPLQDPDNELVALAELLAISRFEPDLANAVRPVVQQGLNALEEVSPKSDRTKDGAAGVVDRTQAFYALNCVLGVLLAWQRPEAKTVDLTSAVKKVTWALAHPSEPVELPPDEATNMRPHKIRTGDPKLDKVLNAIRDEVGASGYDATTLARICEVSGLSKAFLFSEFPTKLDMFMAATEQTLRPGVEKNVKFGQKIAADHGAGIADAVTWREMLRPEHRLGAAIALEQVRVGWREGRMKARVDAGEMMAIAGLVGDLAPADQIVARTEAHWGLGLGYAIYVMGHLMPDAWKLPFDVVTVPLSNYR